MRSFLLGLSALCIYSFLAFGAAQTPQLPSGYAAEPLITGLRGPTQMTFGPRERGRRGGRLWIAQLAGGENSGTGQVVAIDLETLEQEIVLRRLFKPTGLAVTETHLWVMAGNRLLRAPLTQTDAGEGIGDVEVILRDLPSNGRSGGTLTLTPEGALLFETSGALSASARDGGVREGSGVLWRLDPLEPTNPQPLATGLKGAYAHTFDASGTLYSTEIGDDPVNGLAPPDELNLIRAGADYGWPGCYGRAQAAANYGGTAARCAQTEAPLALFAPRATPTSVVASPFGQGDLLVALWAASRVVRVDVNTGAVTPFITGVPLPQHLLVDGEALLLSSFADGTVYRVRATD